METARRRYRPIGQFRHDPEKWMPVFAKRSSPAISWSGMTIREKSSRSRRFAAMRGSVRLLGPMAGSNSGAGFWRRRGTVTRRLGVPKQSPGDDKVGRMQFLLGLRRRGISDPAVLRAMDEVPREHFVESAFVDSAYADQALPIACGQTISQPYVVAYMTEQLGVRAWPSRARSGHRLGLPGRRSLAARARGRQRRALSDAGGHRAQAAGRARLSTMWTCVVGDGLAGVPERAPFRPHHRHRGRRDGSGRAASRSLPTAA